MAVRGSAVHKNLLPCIFTVLSPLNHLVFIMDVCLGHIFESTKGIEIKLGTCIDVTRTIHFTWVISPNLFHKRWFSLSCLGVQVVLDYKFSLSQTLGNWGAFIAHSDFLVSCCRSVQSVWWSPSDFE